MANGRGSDRGAAAIAPITDALKRHQAKDRRLAGAAAGGAGAAIANAMRPRTYLTGMYAHRDAVLAR